MCLAPVAWMPEKTRMEVTSVWSQEQVDQRTRRPRAGLRHARRATTSMCGQRSAFPENRAKGDKSRLSTLGTMAVTSSTWSPGSWRELAALQQPEWPDAVIAAAAVERLKGSPPLVFAGEARQLREGLARVSEGRAFLLQAGDCVESFNEVSTQRIREKLKIMLQMSAVLTYGATLPVVKLGRIAGQYTKPRSEAFEDVPGGRIPSFRGHMVNDEARTAEARTPDPTRMIEGYNQSAATLNLLRAFTKGGYADLTQVHLWNKDFVATSPEGRRYEALASEIERALQFMAACGIDLTGERQL